jgi:single-strand selective monofunctional uracil DNA glycosylase
MDDLTDIMEELSRAVAPMEFAEPVTHVYNPFEYAKEPAELYATKWGKPTPREAVLIGMNPGPWGMAQTGVPFGEIDHVRGWLAIDGFVDKPSVENEKRPIEGFACERSEVSGRRLWGWAKDKFERPEAFFDRFFVWNYCPLVFMEESGRNFTPDKLPVEERDALFAPCDEALRQIVQLYTPRMVIGVGVFAEKRAQTALEGVDVQIGRILHPSPASPKANRGWEGYVEEELDELGINI